MKVARFLIPLSLTALLPGCFLLNRFSTRSETQSEEQEQTITGYIECKRVVVDGEEYNETEKAYLSIAQYRYTDGADYLTNYDGYFYVSLKRNVESFEKDITVDTATTGNHYKATLVKELGIFVTYHAVYYSKVENKIKLVEYTNRNITESDDSEIEQKFINPVDLNENKNYILVGKPYKFTKYETTRYIDVSGKMVTYVQ